MSSNTEFFNLHKVVGARAVSVTYLYPLVPENQVEYRNQKAKTENQDSFQELLNLHNIIFEQQELQCKLRNQEYESLVSKIQNLKLT